MAVARKIYETQFLLGAKVQSSVGKGFGQVQKGIRSIQQQAAMSQKAVGGMSKALKGLLGVAAGYLSFNAIKNFAEQGLELASDLAEVQNVVDTTFQASTDGVNKWSKGALKAYGLGVLQAKQYSGTIGAMLKSSGIATDKLAAMSTTMTGLTGDLASFYNLDHDVAFQKIRSGLSGETEPLKQLGINMSVANLEAYAMSQGIRKAWAKMSQSEQVMLRYNYLLKVSKDVQGDFAKTNKEYANQQRMTQINIAQLSATIMAKFLPAVNKIYIRINELFAGGLPDRILSTIDKTIQFLKKAAPVIEAVTVAIVANKVATLVWIGVQKGALIITTLTKAWGTATAVMSLMREGYSLATIAQMQLNVAMAANPIGLIIAGITALVIAGYYLIKNWDKVKVFFVGLWDGLKKGFNWLKDILIQASEWMAGLMAVIMPVVEIPLLIIKNWSNISGFFKGLFGGGKDKQKPVPKYARGTSFHPGGPAIINERGPELLNLPRGSSVTPANRTQSLLNGLGGGSASISYAPQFIIQGNADEKVLKEANDQAQADFERRIDTYFNRRRRLNFA